MIGVETMLKAFDNVILDYNLDLHTQFLFSIHTHIYIYIHTVLACTVTCEGRSKTEKCSTRSDPSSDPLPDSCTTGTRRFCTEYGTINHTIMLLYSELIISESNERLFF